MEQIEQNEQLQDSLVTIAAETFRFQQVYSKVLSKLDLCDQTKYSSQFAWFTKKVMKALDDAGLRIVDVNGQLYDAGMAVTPLNIEDFEADDILYIAQTMEPIIMQDNAVIKTGTVILGRAEK